MSHAIYPIWDLPSRLSHWAIALLFAAQFISGQYGLFSTAVHLWFGYALLAVVLFRILWGLVGSETARFSRFLLGPSAVLRYLGRLPDRKPTHSPGHNPVGGWSVVLMLLLLIVQSVTGLFFETWDELRGPLAERVSRDTAMFMTDLHATLHWPLLVIVLIHIVAVFWYRVRKREDRIGPIFGSGRIALPRAPEIRFAGSGRALAVLGVSLAVVGAIVILGPI